MPKSNLAIADAGTSAARCMDVRKKANIETPPLASMILTFNEACTAINRSRASVYGLLAAGKLNALKIGRSTVFLRSEIEAFVDRLPAYRPANDGFGCIGE